MLMAFSLSFAAVFKNTVFVQNLRDFKFLWYVLEWGHILVLFLSYEFALLRILTCAGHVMG